MYWVSFATVVGICIAGKRYVAPTKKDKVGVELTLSDLYHPWTDDVKPQAPMSDQHRISEYLLSALKEGDSIDKAISLFETFSSSNHMGMSLGDQKGLVIEKSFAKLTNMNKDLVVLEFGSHIGDGTLRIIRQLAKNPPEVKTTIFSMESNPEWLSIGTSLVRHALAMAGVANIKYVPILLPHDVRALAKNLKTHHGIETVDGLFLDHVHSKFFTDLNILRDHKLLHTGTVIVADNALRHRQVMERFIKLVEEHSSEFELAHVIDPYPDEVLCATWEEKVPERDEL